MEQRYTNPEDRGRYGFSESGKFRAPFKADVVIVSLLFAAIVLAEIFIIGFGIKIIQDNVLQKNEELIYGLIAVVVIVILSALVILGIGSAIRYIINGYPCNYAATDEKFTVNIGGDQQTIYYSDVQDISFTPRSFFGKVRGYFVHITVAGEKREYGVSFDGYQSEKTTPFYIIQERIDAMNHEQDLRRVMKISKSTELGSGISAEQQEAELAKQNRQNQKSAPFGQGNKPGAQPDYIHRLNEVMAQSDEQFLNDTLKRSSQQIPVDNLADKSDSMPTIGETGKKA